MTVRVTVDRCVVQVTHETDVTLTSLEPYTLYTVQVEASNFYSDSPTTTTLLPGNVEYFMTKPGSQYTLYFKNWVELNKMTAIHCIAVVLFNSTQFILYGSCEAGLNKQLKQRRNTL